MPKSPPLCTDLATLAQLRRWAVAHREDHPVEYHLLDAVLTLWLMGWVGLLPALALGHVLLLPLCLLAMLLPGLYLRWRVRAHQRRTLRCDWADQGLQAG